MTKRTIHFLLIGLFSSLLLASTCEDENTTPESTTGTFTDLRDGKTYNWKKIGEQVWMTQNLAFQTAQNCWAYNNDESNVEQYGYLYAWDAAMTAAPEGWHVATDTEWKNLQMLLGLSQTDADESGWMGDQAIVLKSVASWDNNGGGNDSTGFHAQGSGYYLGGGSFGLMGTSGIWWTATEATDFNVNYAWLRQMSANNDAVYRGVNDKSYGYSIRCVRD